MSLCLKRELGPSLSKPGHSYQIQCTLHKLCLSKAMCPGEYVDEPFITKENNRLWFSLSLCLSLSLSLFLSLSLSLHTCMYMCPLKHVPQGMYGGQRSSSEPFLSFHHVGSGDAQGMECRTLVLVASSFTSSSISPAPNTASIC